tara:strand:+ start:2848 stop:3147 length:300 start_codon:yes stop_codon:yes gene_type:complete
MKLKDGKFDEYKKKHDEIWPELSDVLTSLGISNYSIYFDSKDNTLIEYMELSDNNKFDQMEDLNIVKEWNIFMKDLLVTKSENDHTPLVEELTNVFYHK